MLYETHLQNVDGLAHPPSMVVGTGSLDGVDVALLPNKLWRRSLSAMINPTSSPLLNPPTPPPVPSPALLRPPALLLLRLNLPAPLLPLHLSLSVVASLGRHWRSLLTSFHFGTCVRPPVPDDTTASNTGVHRGACTFLQLQLQRQLLWLACRHHIAELILRSAFDSLFSDTTAPKSSSSRF